MTGPSPDQLMRSLWRDERGESSFLGLILIAAIAAIGVIVGLAIVRDSIVQEFGDVSVAIDRLDQTYEVSVINDCGLPFTTLWSASYTDDTGINDLEDAEGLEPACLDLGVGDILDESETLPAPVGNFP